MMHEPDLLCLDDSTYVLSEGSGRSRTHSYLIIGCEKAYLIDTGLGYSNMRAAVDSITRKPVDVLCTHGHLDHIGADAYFNEVHIHPADKELYMQHSDPSYRLAFLQNHAMQKGAHKEYVFSEAFWEENRHLWDLKPSNLICDLTDGLILDPGNRPLRVIHTPGHTQGSICLLDETRKSLYTGDTICEQGVLLSFAESAPVNVFLNSMEKLWKMRGEYSLVLSGHQAIPLEQTYVRDFLLCAEYGKSVASGKNILTYGRARLTLLE